eukprot:TRINITY_DN43993_c0_g1_i1.p1 TRINITY_DN43993_c0_g1~~TRINITY_DN43993_c0_g1_i1.p1  ORF type:complete len:515 (+),score=114.52 TRINITY_DN43993_c0_g1_i1:113-1657(+)
MSQQSREDGLRQRRDASNAGTQHADGGGNHEQAADDSGEPPDAEQRTAASETSSGGWGWGLWIVIACFVAPPLLGRYHRRQEDRGGWPWSDDGAQNDEELATLVKDLGSAADVEEAAAGREELLLPFSDWRRIEVRPGRASPGDSWQALEARADLQASRDVGPSGRHIVTWHVKALIPPEEAAFLLRAARSFDYHQENDTIAEPPFLVAPVLRHGKKVATDAGAMLGRLRPLVNKRVHPYIRGRFGCHHCVVCSAFFRREKGRQVPNFDMEALATVVIPLSQPEDYVGGLFVQPGFNITTRRSVQLASGDALVHSWDLRHGLEVSSGVRTSLVFRLKPSRSSCDLGSAPWYEATTAEDGFGMHQIGRRHELGIEEEQNSAVSWAWYQRAAALDHAEASYRLGVMAEQGQGAPPAGMADETAGADFFQHYQKAAEKWHPDAMYKLSRCLSEGRGTAKDTENGFAWLLRAAEQGSEAAQMEAARSYLGADRDEAARWLARAAKQGNEEAQQILERL